MGVLGGRVGVIVGGTSGIGAATARLFAQEGATVVLAGRREEQGEKLAAELGPVARFVRTDASVETQVAGLMKETVRCFGRLDCLLNCAGAGGTPGGIAAVDLSKLRRTWAVHVEGVVSAMKHAAPIMARQGSGSIVNVASIGGELAGWTFLDYSAAKAAVIQLTRAVATELAELGVRVNSISPGPILTGIFAKGAGVDSVEADRTAELLGPVFDDRLESWQPIRRAGLPSDVAGVALWLASDTSQFVTGQNVNVDGGITAGRPPSVSAADRAAIGKALLASLS